MLLTEKQEQLLDLIKKGKGEAGIYQLALTASRPYRRVHDNVITLARHGLVELTEEKGARAFTRVSAVVAEKKQSEETA